MRTILFSLLGLALFLGIAGCTKNAESMDSMKMSNASPKADASKAITYTCTMHPEVVSSSPGKCPKCGMDLVEKK